MMSFASSGRASRKMGLILFLCLLSSISKLRCIPESISGSITSLKGFNNLSVVSGNKSDYDILLTPTTGLPAFELGIPFPSEINGKVVSPTAWMPFTSVFNLTGLPAASIPCGWSSDGLPIGMQIIANRWRDELVLQVSKVFEEIAPWQDKRPSFN